MPKGVVKTRADEVRWNKAKQIASKQRKKDDPRYYGLVMHIYMGMRKGLSYQDIMKGRLPNDDIMPQTEKEMEEMYQNLGGDKEYRKVMDDLVERTRRERNKKRKARRAKKRFGYRVGSDKIRRQRKTKRDEREKSNMNKVEVLQKISQLFNEATRDDGLHVLELPKIQDFTGKLQSCGYDFYKASNSPENLSALRKIDMTEWLKKHPEATKSVVAAMRVEEEEKAGKGTDKKKQSGDKSDMKGFQGSKYEDEEEGCDTPGLKIRSKSKGRGLAIGKGKGPIGVPFYSKSVESGDIQKIAPVTAALLRAGKKTLDTAKKIKRTSTLFGRKYKRGLAVAGAGVAGAALLGRKIRRAKRESNKRFLSEIKQYLPNKKIRRKKRVKETDVERYERTGGGMKIRSKGAGRGLARGEGRGPIGVPYEG